MVGVGFCGLRVVVELVLLGVRVVLVEKRIKFFRYNVFYFWFFIIYDFRVFGVKKFYGRFCIGILDYISEYYVVVWRGG